MFKFCYFFIIDAIGHGDHDERHKSSTEWPIVTL